MSRLRRILVDGGSGAGKTSLARGLQQRWTDLSGEAVQLVGLDDIYPGWDGLAEGSLAVVRDVLAPGRHGYRRWDWEASRPTDWVEVDPTRPLIVEGCGALTPASLALCDLAIWLEVPAGERRRRALARDGEAYQPHWERWARQEEAHWRAHHPRRLAHLVIAR